MDWLNQLGGLLKNYSSPEQVEGNPEEHFDQVAQHAPQQAIADGLAGAFRSQATPPFPQMLSQMFGNSGGDQKASILNMLIGAVGSGAFSNVLSPSGGIGGLGNLLGGGQTHITPEQAEQIPPEAVQELAQNAEQKDTSIIDRISYLYAQQPGIIKTLGAGALTIALTEIGRRNKLL